MNLPALLLLTALVLPLNGQDKGRAIRIRTLCFELVPGERELTASGDPALASTAEIKLSRRLGSEQASLTLLGNQVLLGIPGENAKRQRVIKPMAVATIPPAGKQFLILLVPSGKTKGEVYKSMVLSDEAKDFPAGAFRLVNLSPSPMRFAMGEERLELPPGKIKVVKEVSGVREDGRFSYVAQYREGGTWNRLSTGYWNHRERVRSLQIAYLDPRTKRLTMRGYDDTMSLRP